MQKIQTTNTLSIASVLQQLMLELTPTSPTPRLDAEVLVMHVSGLDRSGLITQAQLSLTREQQLGLDALLIRRTRGEPIAYLIGWREFWSMELTVSPDTLIPRPETEVLVEQALARIPHEARWNIADLGTGSGAIALALAKERPHCRFIATDISPAALAMARLNAEKFCLGNIEFRHGSWLAPCTGETLDMIVSNPPYIGVNDPHLQQGDVVFEPRQALIAGADGLGAIRQIAAQARAYLKPGAWLLFEHGWGQRDASQALLVQQGYYEISCYRDTAGHGRVSACHT